MQMRWNASGRPARDQRAASVREAELVMKGSPVRVRASALKCPCKSVDLSGVRNLRAKYKCGLPICPTADLRLWRHLGAARRCPSAGTSFASSATRGTGLVREVPAPRRPPGAAQARARLDRARPAAGGLLHEAPGRGPAADVLDQARRGHAPGDRPHRAHVRRRRGGVPALHRARPRAQAVDREGLPLDRERAAAARVRRAARSRT